MPEQEWTKSGWMAYKKALTEHLARCLRSVTEEEAFHNNVLGLMAVASPLVEGDEQFKKDLRKAEEKLGDRRPNIPYRLKQLRALVRALVREGTLGKADIPFEESGTLEDMAVDNANGGASG